MPSNNNPIPNNNNNKYENKNKHDKSVTSPTCKLTSSSSCRPPKPALDDNEIY